MRLTSRLPCIPKSFVPLIIAFCIPASMEAVRAESFLRRSDDHQPTHYTHPFRGLGETPLKIFAMNNLRRYQLLAICVLVAVGFALAIEPQKAAALIRKHQATFADNKVVG